MFFCLGPFQQQFFSKLPSPLSVTAAQVSASSLQVWLVDVKSGYNAAPQSLYLPGSAAMVARSFRGTADSSIDSTAVAGLWTAGYQVKMKMRQPGPGNLISQAANARKMGLQFLILSCCGIFRQQLRSKQPIAQKQPGNE
jgi:hypothetical protein